MARIPVESEAAFSTLLSSITEDTVTASIHWRLCKDLWAAVPEFVRELNQSPAFWSLTLNAHREVAMFRLGWPSPALVDTLVMLQLHRWRRSSHVLLAT